MDTKHTPAPSDKNQETIRELVAALELFLKFFDEMPKGQLGRIVCDIGILNDAFLASSKALAKAKVEA